MWGRDRQHRQTVSTLALTRPNRLTVPRGNRQMYRQTVRTLPSLLTVGSQFLTVRHHNRQKICPTATKVLTVLTILTVQPPLHGVTRRWKRGCSNALGPCPCRRADCRGQRRQVDRARTEDCRGARARARGAQGRGSRGVGRRADLARLPPLLWTDAALSAVRRPDPRCVGSSPRHRRSAVRRRRALPLG